MAVSSGYSCSPFFSFLPRMQSFVLTQGFSLLCFVLHNSLLLFSLSSLSSAVYVPCSLPFLRLLLCLLLSCLSALSCLWSSFLALWFSFNVCSHNGSCFTSFHCVVRPTHYFDVANGGNYKDGLPDASSSYSYVQLPATMTPNDLYQLEQFCVQRINVYRQNQILFGDGMASDECRCIPLWFFIPFAFSECVCFFQVENPPMIHPLFTTYRY